MDLILAIALMVVFALVGAGGGYFYRKNMAEKRIGRTEEYAKKLLDDATRKAAETKKEMEIEAKEEVLRLKTKLDDEIRTRRAEMQRSERRVNQREEMLDKKMDNLEKREEAINKKSEQTQALYDEAEQLRVAGGEYGASTGRPRRVGPIDLVATRYGCRIQGATEVALTKLDVLSYMKEIPVCTQYEVNGEKTDDFPFTAVIDEAKPVLTTVPGWGCDISGVRKYEDLPQAARDYVEFIEKSIGVHISYVSVGAGRDEIIYR